MTQEFPFYDTTLPREKRIDDLVGRLTLEEKVGQMLHEAPAIPRLGIAEYNWWNECLHGVARAGIATVFPQAIGLAATWNASLLFEVAGVISDEGRAKHHEAVRRGERAIYQGLTFWSPNINIFRDPRWGRGQETYGEDPYLTAQMGIAFVKGVQGDDPRYLKAAACAKHYAVHSGPEADRHHFDAHVSARDLWETYLPAFEALVREAGVESVMGAYNRTNGEACCASPTLLVEILREKWGFDGHVVSDCWAIADIYKHHKIVETREEAAAMAVTAGCDLNCGCTFDALVAAVRAGLIEEEALDVSLKRLLRTRFKLGLFDPPEQVPYTGIPFEVNDSPPHAKLAYRAALESIVLLKNDQNLLPLDRAAGSIAVIGPNADDAEVLLGNYAGTPSNPITVLAGIRAAVTPGTTVHYAQGCDLFDQDTSGFAKALVLARQADVIVFVGGISQRMESEEITSEDGVTGGDRADIALPAVQRALLERLQAVGKPIVFVLLNGGPVASPWADEHIPAIVEAWYPGQAGGAAIANVLFGEHNPAGRLPVTVYRSLDDVPDFNDYAMLGRTYRYFEGTPLYPFGYGLSYTTFEYSDLRVSASEIASDAPLRVTVQVQNTGPVAGDEVVQVYVRDQEAAWPVPRHSLQAFTRVHLTPGEAQTLEFTLEPRQFAVVNERGDRCLEPGTFEVFAGGGQPGYAETVSTSVRYNGERVTFAFLYGSAH